MTSYSETCAVFRSGGNRLVGIASVPDDCSSVGVLLLVGGPQYRVGSHRSFTLLARSLAEAGIPSFRFDYTGMGDSEGERRDFHEVQGDIRTALDHFHELVPGLSRVVLWGLCDAASSALIHAWQDPRIAGLILLNPWVHSGDYSPEVKLSHYYAPLLRGRDTWKRFFTGQIKVVPVVTEFFGDAKMLVQKALSQSFGVPVRHSFVSGMLDGMHRFKGETLIILSEKDLTSREFLSLVSNEKDWKSAMSRAGVRIHEVPEADHTLSRKVWREEVTQLTVDWLRRPALRSES